MKPPSSLLTRCCCCWFRFRALSSGEGQLSVFLVLGCVLVSCHKPPHCAHCARAQAKGSAAADGGSSSSRGDVVPLAASSVASSPPTALDALPATFTDVRLADVHALSWLDEHARAMRGQLGIFNPHFWCVGVCRVYRALSTAEYAVQWSVHACMKCCCWWWRWWSHKLSRRSGGIRPAACVLFCYLQLTWPACVAGRMHTVSAVRHAPALHVLRHVPPMPALLYCCTK